MPNQNFGLSQTEFDALVRRLRAGDESLFEHIFRKHFDDCRRFLIFEKRVPQEDAYDLTIDTILEFQICSSLGKYSMAICAFFLPASPTPLGSNARADR